MIEVLDAAGRPVPRVLLQAVRDTQINFRAIDANASAARLDHYEEMELNQFLYLQGDVMRLFRMPQGPDSDMLFYSRAVNAGVTSAPPQPHMHCTKSATS